MPTIGLIFVIGVIAAIISGVVMARKHNMYVGIVTTSCITIATIVATIVFDTMTNRTNTNHTDNPNSDDDSTIGAIGQLFSQSISDMIMLAPLLLAVIATGVVIHFMTRNAKDTM